MNTLALVKGIAKFQANMLRQILKSFSYSQDDPPVEFFSGVDPEDIENAIIQIKRWPNKNGIPATVSIKYPMNFVVPCNGGFRFNPCDIRLLLDGSGYPNPHVYSHGVLCRSGRRIASPSDLITEVMDTLVLTNVSKTSIEVGGAVPSNTLASGNYMAATKQYQDLIGSRLGIKIPKTSTRNLLIRGEHLGAYITHRLEISVNNNLL